MKPKIDREKLRRLRNIQIAFDHLLANPCVDCGETNPIVLEFDHVRGEKITDVSSMLRKAFSPKKIVDEIAKCEVRCANCHRKVTAQRGEWYMHAMYEQYLALKKPL